MKKIIVTENQFKKIVKQVNNEPTLNEIYSTKNISKIIPLTETNAKRLIERHITNGFAIVSACRGGADFGLDTNNLKEKMQLSNINKIRTKEMINLIIEKGFSYTLSYGGFIENQGEDNEENVYERSCIIYAEKKNGEVDSQGMYMLALEICRKYNQDSVLVKMPNDNPQYITQDGNVDMVFNGDIAFNDLAQIYFTDLHKNTQSKITPNSKATRFSFMKSYIAPKPQCYSESHIRNIKGEIFLKK